MGRRRLWLFMAAIPLSFGLASMKFTAEVWDGRNIGERRILYMPGMWEQAYYRDIPEYIVEKDGCQYTEIDPS